MYAELQKELKCKSQVQAAIRKLNIINLRPFLLHSINIYILKTNIIVQKGSFIIKGQKVHFIQAKNYKLNIAINKLMSVCL